MLSAIGTQTPELVRPTNGTLLTPCISSLAFDPPLGVQYLNRSEETIMNRRQFLKDASVTMGAALISPSLLDAVAFDQTSVSHVAFVKTTDRAEGVKRAI